MRSSHLTAVATAGTVVVVAAFASMALRQRPADAYYALFLLHNGPSAILLLWLSRLVLRRRPGHGAGRVLLAIAVFQTLHVGVSALLDARLVAAGIEAPLESTTSITPADLPLDASIPLWLMSWLWVPAAVLAFTMLALVFPDGRLPGRRWRPVVAITAAGGGLLTLALAIDAWPTARHWEREDAPAIVGILLVAGSLAVLVAAVAGLTALVLRWRATDRALRSPFVAVAGSVAALTVVGVAAYPWQVVWIPATLVGLNAVFVVYGLAVARYRLHDLEPVLGRAAVGALLSVLVAGVYLTLVVGVGSLVGRRVDSPLLPLLAVGAVALLIEPARRRARRLVDRLLYRRDADRSEVLSRLTAHASTSSGAEVLAEVAELLVRGTGATRAEAWLDGGAEPWRAAAAGAGDDEAEAWRAGAGDDGDDAWCAAVAGASDGGAEPALRASVEHRGERFGELRLYSRAPADLVSDAPQLLGDVARALGLVLHNDRLTEQLRARLDELQASRQRLVEAQDHARRGLERDIHDGVQARLISLRLKLGALRVRAGDDPPGAELDALGREVDVAIRSLRDLARGLHPPILEQSGLADALRAHVRDLPLAVSVSARGVGRYQRAAEGAAYFSCLEAIQNAIRHSGAGRITVELDGDRSALRFCVRDDGAGFRRDGVHNGSGLANIDDRVSALGGRTDIVSAPGQGTRVSGEIPVQPLTEDR